MMRSKPQGDLHADILVELTERLIHSTGTTKPMATVEACALIDSVVADVADDVSQTERVQLFALLKSVRARVLAANPA